MVEHQWQKFLILSLGRKYSLKLFAKQARAANNGKGIGMVEGKPYLSWPEANADDRIVGEEMLRDPLSELWFECNEAVIRFIQAKATNLPPDSWDDIAQDVMERIRKSLPTFEYRCALTTWIFGIARSCIIDAYRKLKHERQHFAPPGDPHDDHEYESDTITTYAPKTVEDESVTREDVREALAALQEYISRHAKPERNRQILYMVLDEGRSLEETAMAVGCSAPVVGYIVRSARSYVRGRLERKSVL